jgi:hypothetical protein
MAMTEGWAQPVVRRLDGQTALHFFHLGRSSLCRKYARWRGLFHADPDHRGRYAPMGYCSTCWARRLRELAA